jgi:inhibitor of cysteine peptidase
MKRDNILSILLVGFLMIALLGLTACSKTPTPNIPSNSDLSASQELKKFNNIEEFRTFMSQTEASANGATVGANYRGGVMMDFAVSKVSAEATTSAPSANAAQDAGGSGSVDYSQTNVQVKGVDEADFVKNDDRYIYIISNNELVIIDGKDGTNSNILSETKISVKSDKNYGAGTVRDIFLNDDKVIIFADAYEREIYFDKYNIQPIEGSRQSTKVLVYDVSDKKNPELSDEYTISGAYFNSRMINNIVYTVTQEYLYDWRYYDGPMIAYAKTTIRPDIYYFDNPEQSYQMNTITSIDVNKDEVVDSMSFMLGYGNTLMVSEDNIYIAYQKQSHWCWGWRCTSSYTTDARERFVTVVLPLLQGEIKTDVESIMDKNLPEDEEWIKISAVLSNLYSDLQDDENLQDKYNDMFTDIEDALNEYDAKKALEESKTIIHQIAIKDGQMEYGAKGEVDGRLLNQFSMDEYNGNLRVATTISLWLNNGRAQYNNVYVLDKNMDVTGKLTDLAENESIYSTRFMGDKLYMVTFRQIDPFFVIDLSNPKQPEVLGYLKIPGYSSYLHPINDKYIIGVGKDTGENEWGGISTKGLKITLFDVSDFKNPKAVDTETIGLEGSDSPVLYDHRAFLYSSSKNMLVIPLTEVVERVKSGYNYRTSVWYGAYVFEVSEEGFKTLGKIKHSSSETQYYYWYDASNVKRSLYIGDTLYTISDRYVKANDLGKELEELNSIRLPWSEADNRVYPEMVVE